MIHPVMRAVTSFSVDNLKAMPANGVKISGNMVRNTYIKKGLKNVSYETWHTLLIDNSDCERILSRLRVTGH